MKSRIYSLLIGVVIISFLFLTNIYPHIQVEKITPGGSMYGYFYSHLEDYFIYVTLIRRGLDDHQILYHNPYSYLPTKAVLNHPFFMILGQVARLIQVDQYQMYVLARILTVLFMISAMFMLIRKIFPNNSYHQLLATILVFTSTGIWHIQNVAGLEPMPINPTEDAANYFNAFYRFLLLPPHHFLAMGLFILFLIHIPSIKMSGKSFLITAIFSFLIIIIQPYYAFYLGPILGLFALYKLIHSRSQSIPFFLHIGIFFVSIVPYMIYINAALKEIIDSKFSLSLLIDSSRGAPVIEIAKALGIVCIPFILFLILSVKKKLTGLHVLLILWAVLPIVLYQIPYLYTLFGQYRILQTFLQIPFAILGTQGLMWLTQRYAKIGGIVSLNFVGVSVVYYLMLYSVSLKFLTKPQMYGLLPHDAIMNTWQYAPLLTRYIPTNSVVITGETIAPIIASVTPFRVINAQVAGTPNYAENVDAVRKFYYGQESETEAKAFLETHHVGGILFGYGSNPLPELYKSYSFLKPVYTKDQVTIVTYAP